GAHVDAVPLVLERDEPCVFALGREVKQARRDEEAGARVAARAGDGARLLEERLEGLAERLVALVLLANRLDERREERVHRLAARISGGQLAQAHLLEEARLHRREHRGLRRRERLAELLARD